MEKKLSPEFELKGPGVSDDGTFEGILSMYGNVDAGGDVVVPGAFTKTIKDNRGRCPLLWQHDPGMPIGSLQLFDTGEALEVKGKLWLDQDIPQARTAYAQLKRQKEDGLAMGMSIGYEIVNKKPGKDDIRRYLTEIKLREGSLVTFAMNDQCLVTEVKSEADLAKELDEAVDALIPALKSLQDFMSEKSGRVLSASNRSKLETIFNDLQALLAAASTSLVEAAAEGEPKAATVPAEPDSAAIHSAISRIAAMKLR